MYEKYLQVIDGKAAEIDALSDYIWENAEPAFHEFKSSKRLADELEANGFTLTRKLIGIPTAFKATFGEGHPAFGILAEFDALEGLAQEAGVAEENPIEGKRYGHGCGHNLFAGGSFAAALAVKAFLEEKGTGSVTLFGCPAEEGGGGKAFMAREGIFNGIDAIVSWHPERFFMPRTRPSLAAISIDYSFKGIAAHAGGAPEKGRSALDAVELMNVGANYLREHMHYTSRLHYAMIDSGGTAPNVVQAHASVRYMVRTVDSASLAELVSRVDKIAQGAALMTETEMSKSRRPAYSNLITNSVLQATAYKAMTDIPVPQPDENDVAFGDHAAYRCRQKASALSVLRRRTRPAQTARRIHRHRGCELERADRSDAHRQLGHRHARPQLAGRCAGQEPLCQSHDALCRQGHRRNDLPAL